MLSLFFMVDKPTTAPTPTAILSTTKNPARGVRLTLKDSELKLYPRDPSPPPTIQLPACMGTVPTLSAVWGRESFGDTCADAVYSPIAQQNIVINNNFFFIALMV